MGTCEHFCTLWFCNCSCPLMQLRGHNEYCSSVPWGSHCSDSCCPVVGAGSLCTKSLNPMAAPGCTSPRGAIGTHQHLCAPWLYSCQWPWAHVHMYPPLHLLGHVGFCPASPLGHTTSRAVSVIDTSSSVSPLGVRQSTPSSPFQGSQAEGAVSLVVWLTVYGVRSWKSPLGLLTTTSLPTPVLGPSIGADSVILSESHGILRPQWST